MVGNRNLAVGIFVSVALTVLIVFTVWISGKRGNEPTTQYAILIENDVSGLMLGGPVFFLGVGVGEVIALTIMPGDPVGVRVDIEILSSTPVDAGTWATLAAQGITGVSVINLSSDPGKHEPLVKAEEEEHAMIPYRDSGFSAILSSAPAILTKMETLLDRAGMLLDEGNQQAVSNTLANIQAMTDSLAAEDSGLGELPGSLNDTLVEIQTTVEELRAMLQNAGPGLTAALDNIDDVMRNLADVTARLDDWVDSNEEEMQNFVGEGLGQIPALISDARSAVREMEKLLEELRRDPSGFIYQAPEDAVPVEEE